MLRVCTSDSNPSLTLNLTLNPTLTIHPQVYGEASVGSEVGLHEHSTLEPTNPYSAAKAGAEMMVRLLVVRVSVRVRVTVSQCPSCNRKHADADVLKTVNRAASARTTSKKECECALTHVRHAEDQSMLGGCLDDLLLAAS